MSFKIFLESRANKFHLNWQIVRTKARKFKKVADKINLVIDFLKKYPNIHNYGRIDNWLKTSKMAQSNDPNKDELFANALNNLHADIEKYSSTEDPDISIEDVSSEDLLEVYNDLRKRTYNFQMKGKIPSAHTAFEDNLKKELDNRRISYKNRGE